MKINKLFSFLPLTLLASSVFIGTNPVNADGLSPDIDNSFSHDTEILVAGSSNRQQVIDKIKSEGRFAVIFNKVKGRFNDRGWQGRKDPMGTLLANERYDVTYHQGAFTTRGYNEYYKHVHSSTYSNANIDNAQISLWGRVYTFDGDNNVYDPEYGIVGTLII